jgi:predicted house-cleaning noncanonical NTP pyrophosphatase (MazG superfamily)
MRRDLDTVPESQDLVPVPEGELMSYKMVRDNHQEILQGAISGTWRTSPDPVTSLITKLGEEYGEFAGTRDPAEIYDMLDALDELIALLDPDETAAKTHQVKLDRMGDFSGHLEWHPNPSIDLWTLWDKGEA